MKNNHIWLIEVKLKGKWYPWLSQLFDTRREARVKVLKLTVESCPVVLIKNKYVRTGRSAIYRVVKYVSATRPNHKKR